MTKRSTSTVRIITPLWIISLFISLTETVVGVAAVRASGVVQVLFTVFAIAFPILVACAFFWILWHRPWVFYTPQQYSQTGDARTFIDALRSRSLPTPPDSAASAASPSSPENASVRCSYDAGFILTFIHRQMERGRLTDVMAVFDEFKRPAIVFEANVELRALHAVLGRLCGRPDSYRLLSAFTDAEAEAFHATQYELALLRYAKGSTSGELASSIDLQGLPSGFRRLHASLLAIACLGEGDLGNASVYFDMMDIERSPRDAHGAYCALQTAIVSAALGLGAVSVKHFDAARTINRSVIYPGRSYPYVAVVAKYDRAFVNNLISVQRDSVVEDADIRFMRGHCHVLGRHARIFRLSDSAVETFVAASQSWRNPLSKDGVCHRLKDFESRLLAKAGTIFVGGVVQSAERSV